MITSTKELEEFLLSQTSAILNDNEIYDMGDYGWEDVNTADPEYIGHAIIQTNPPFGWDIMNPPAEIPELEQWQKDCAIAQADFSGIMRMAQLSIGLTNVHAEEFKKDFFSEGDLFNLHWMGSVVNLSIASDRIRDFFVTSIFEKIVAEYNKGKFNSKKRNLYQTPFLEALSRLQSIPSNPPMPIEKIIQMSEEIQKFRDRRNLVIHEVATHRGAFEKQRVNGQLQPTAPDIIDYEDIRKLQEQVMTEHKDKISEELAGLKKWYELLVKFSSDIFVSGHAWQRRQQN